MYLRQRPTYYVKGSERFAAHYTVQARDLEAQGWVKEEEQKPAAKKQETSPEPAKAKAAKSVKEKIVEAVSGGVKSEPASGSVKTETETSGNG